MVDVQCDEPLYRRVAEFVRAHRREFDCVVEWLLDLLEKKYPDRHLDYAWERSVVESPRDWRKLVFLAWLLTDMTLTDDVVGIPEFDTATWVGRGRQGPSPPPQVAVYMDTIGKDEPTAHAIIADALDWAEIEIVGCLLPWKHHADGYIPLTEAKRIAGVDLALSTLSKKIKRPDAKVRHMVRGQRCKVHLIDFSKWWAKYRELKGDTAVESGVEIGRRWEREYAKKKQKERR